MNATLTSDMTWPPKVDVLGVQITPVTCDEACESIMRAVERQERAVVSAYSVHALVEAVRDTELRESANHFAMIVPDGQPVRWALNWLHNAKLGCNVRGSDMMSELCQRAAHEDISIYLYGGAPATLTALQASLRSSFPALRIAGAESPPFRPLSADEERQMIHRVNASGAGLMFIGLGCPKQDYFAARFADRLDVVQLCVGAAFDFHAGTKPTAPLWMQRYGLEWLFRLYQEPQRLWKRYLTTNTHFMVKLAGQLVLQRLRCLNVARASGRLQGGCAHDDVFDR
jgi:N-acetylglucosaminyldiphosphoundecaprenol N-acetyl-beta-D-mannosaminyltransferase